MRITRMSSRSIISLTPLSLGLLNEKAVDVAWTYQTISVRPRQSFQVNTTAEAMVLESHYKSNRHHPNLTNRMRWSTLLLTVSFVGVVVWYDGNGIFVVLSPRVAKFRSDSTVDQEVVIKKILKIRKVWQKAIGYWSTCFNLAGIGDDGDGLRSPEILEH